MRFRHIELSKNCVFDIFRHIIPMPSSENRQELPRQFSNKISALANTQLRGNSSAENLDLLDDGHRERSSMAQRGMPRKVANEYHGYHRLVINQLYKRCHVQY